MQPTGKTAEQVRHYQTGRTADENSPARRNAQFFIQHKPRHCAAKGLVIQIEQHGVLPQRNQPPRGFCSSTHDAQMPTQNPLTLK